MAEIELSVLQNQCLGDRRIPTKEELTHEIAAWEQRRNQDQKGITWQFTNSRARTKLLKLYPKIEVWGVVGFNKHLIEP